MIYFLILFFINAQTFASSICDIQRPKNIFHQKEDTFYYLIDLPVKILTQAPHRNFSQLEKFQREITDKVNIDPYELLRRQKKFYENDRVENNRFNKILSRQVGKIRPINCLEAFLLNTHIRSFSAFVEFEALIFENPKINKIRILVQTQGSKQSVIRKPFIENYIRTHLRAGWRLRAHIHNHPFSLNNPYGDIAGTVIPSAPDIESYNYLSNIYFLKSAIVINGFHSLTLNNQDFKKF
ncbi:MAG: hypothetical protein M9962_08740 [Oligoflexia bacterium]|nr:hypothetical protein [Oligoflexia bacterium]